MLECLPPKFWKIFPLVLNGIFIVSGIVLIVFGAIRLKQSRDKDDLFGVAEAGAATNGAVELSLGSADLILGITGVVAVLLNRRWLHYTFAGLIVCTILINVLTFYGLVLTHTDDLRETTSNLKQMARDLYGNNSRPDGQKFTKLINDLQSNRPCCGLSGDNTVNIFLDTPWHRQSNSSKMSSVRSLPDSCCTSHTPECFSATKIKAARDAGHVHKEDCIRSLNAIFVFFLSMIFLEVALGTFMQLIAVIFTILFLKFGPAPES